MGLMKISTEVVRDFAERIFNTLNEHEREYMFDKLVAWKRDQTKQAAEKVQLNEEEMAIARPPEGGNFVSWADLARKIMARTNVSAAVAREAIDLFIMKRHK